MRFLYQAFGLVLSSELTCPGLPPASGPPDALIRRGPVPSVLPQATATGPFHQVSPDSCLLTLDQVAGARFLIRHGEEIVIEQMAAAGESTVRLYLLGAALAALLYQRQVLPMHGSAVAVNGGAALLAGSSGAGKSTLAARLAQCGQQVLCDDLCAVTLGESGQPLAHSGSASLALRADVLARLGLDSQLLDRVRPSEEKYWLPPGGSSVSEPLPLQAVYVLCPAAVSRPRLTLLRGAASVALLRRQAYHGGAAAVLRRQPLLFHTVTALAATASVYLVERPHHPFLLDELADLILATLSAPAVAVVPGGSTGW